MSKSVVGIALLLSVSLPLIAQSISLEDIFSYTSKNALSLKMKQLDVSIEKSNIESAESGYYPTFNLLYNTEYTESLDGIPLGTESIGGITISNGTRYQNSAALQMNYNLYSFGATDKAVLMAKLSTDSKYKEWCLQEKKLYEQILQTYADALKLSKDKEYKTKMLQVRKKLYKAKERLYKVGQYSKVDLGDEAISLITLERDIENAHMQYTEDIIKISQLSYMPIDKEDRLLALNAPNDLNQSIQAFEESTDALVLQKKIEAKKAEKIKTKSQGNPFSVELKHFALNDASVEFKDNSLENSTTNKITNIYANAYIARSIQAWRRDHLQKKFCISKSAKGISSEVRAFLPLPRRCWKTALAT